MYIVHYKIGLCLYKIPVHFPQNSRHSDIPRSSNGLVLPCYIRSLTRAYLETVGHWEYNIITLLFNDPDFIQ